MSAWIVGRRQIDCLVRALTESELVIGVEPDDIGRILWRENVKSIHYRYPDTEENDADYPGPIDFRKAWVDAYTYTRPDGPLDADGWQALKLIARSYNYQSCEHPEWKTSQAYAWTQELLEHLDEVSAKDEASSNPYSQLFWDVDDDFTFPTPDELPVRWKAYRAEYGF